MAEHTGPVVHGTMRGGGYGAKDAIDGAIPHPWKRFADTLFKP
jgi:hypothetical protein